MVEHNNPSANGAPSPSLNGKAGGHGTFANRFTTPQSQNQKKPTGPTWSQLENFTNVLEEAWQGIKQYTGQNYDAANQMNRAIVTYVSDLETPGEERLQALQSACKEVYTKLDQSPHARGDELRHLAFMLDQAIRSIQPRHSVSPSIFSPNGNGAAR